MSNQANNGNFSNKWRNVQLGEVCEKPEYGFTASATKKDTGTKFLRITDITDSGVDWKSVPFCECSEQTKRKYLLDFGDLVVARIGATTGKAFLIEDCPDAVFASYLIRIRPKIELASEFLDTFFKSENYWKQIEQNKGGKLKGGVNTPILQRLNLPLPPLTEQKAIAKVLHSVQEAKEARQTELRLERERKNALMDYLFTHGTRGESLKQTEIGEMPESWEVIEIGQKEFFNIKASFPNFSEISKLDTANLSDVQVLAIKVSDMNPSENKKIIQKSQAAFRFPKCEKLEKFLKPGSMVFPKRGAAIATNKKRLTQNYCILDPNLIGVEASDLIDTEFMFGYFERFDLTTLQDNNPIPQLNKNDVERIKFPLPSLKEQKEIAEVLQACDEKISALENEINLHNEFFKAMLEELMSGNLSSIPLIEN